MIWPTENLPTNIFSQKPPPLALLQGEPDLRQIPTQDAAFRFLRPHCQLLFLSWIFKLDGVVPLFHTILPPLFLSLVSAHFSFSLAHMCFLCFPMCPLSMQDWNASIYLSYKHADCPSVLALKQFDYHPTNQDGITLDIASRILLTVWNGYSNRTSWVKETCCRQHSYTPTRVLAAQPQETWYLVCQSFSKG